MITEELRRKAEAAAAALEEIARVLTAGAASLGGSWAKANEWAHELNEHAAKRRAHRFSIMVMGEFKRGKSTLLNAMLGSRVLPQKITPCTAVITRIVHGTEPRVRVIYGEPGREPAVMTPEEFEKHFSLQVEDTVRTTGSTPFKNEEEEEAFYDQAVRDKFGHIEEAVLEYPCELCQNGVELVDSPGLSEHPSRELRTLEELKKADAVVMVLSAMQMLNERERKALSDKLAPFREQRKLFFAINRWNEILSSLVDPNDEQEARAAFSEQEKSIQLLLHPLLGAVAERRVFRINALGAVQWRKNPGNPCDLEKTGVPGLEDALRDFLLNDRLHAEQSGDAAEVAAIEDRLQMQARSELASLNDSIADLEARYQAALPRLDELRARTRHIEYLLRAKSSELSERLCTSLDNYFKDEVEADLQEYVGGMDLGPAGKMFTRLKGAFDDWRDEKDKVSTQIQSHLETALSQYLNPKITQWAEHAAKPLLQESAGDITDAVTRETTGYDKQLDEISRSGGGSKAMEAIIRKAIVNLSQPGMDEVKGVGLNLSPLITALVVDIVGHIALHTTMTVALPGIGLIISSLLMFWRKQSMVAGTRASIVEGLRSQFPKLLLQQHEELRRKVSDVFTRVTRDINAAVEDQIAQIDASMRDVIEQKKQKEFSATERAAEIEAFMQRFHAAALALQHLRDV